MIEVIRLCIYLWRRWRRGEESVAAEVQGLQQVRRRGLCRCEDMMPNVMRGRRRWRGQEGVVVVVGGRRMGRRADPLPLH